MGKKRFQQLGFVKGAGAAHRLHRLGKLGDKQLFQERRVSLRLPAAARRQLRDWEYDWLILPDEMKYGSVAETKVNFVEDGELIEVSLRARFE